jgi:hypothetical protein
MIVPVDAGRGRWIDAMRSMGIARAAFKLS